MFWKANLKLIIIAAVAGAVISNIATFTVASFVGNDEAKEGSNQNLIASIPLHTRNNQTSTTATTINTTTETAPAPKVLSAANTKQFSASAMNTATGIFETAETVSENTETKTAENSEPEELGTKCSFNDDSFPLKKSIIFNEINWAGSEDNSNHEWIELKNISKSELDISDYEIIDLKEQIKIKIQNRVTLPKNALYLLKRGEDTLSSISAPIYTGALSNSSEGLRLFNESCQLEDEALADPNWSAGDSKERLTMERKSNLDWQSSEKAGGTPAKSNSKGQEESEEGNNSSSSSEEENEEENGANEGVFESDPEIDPDPEPEPEPEPEEPSSDCININSASLEELDEIKGVGPSIGQKIIDARPFSSLDELDDKVSGIGESRLSDIIAEGKACVE